MRLAVLFYFFYLVSLTIAAENGGVVIRGTPSMLHLGQQLIALYQKDFPDAKIAINVSDSVLSVPAGGSAIWQTVRPLDKTQREQLQQRFGSIVDEIPIAIEGVVVIENRSNPVGDLTLRRQLAAEASGYYPLNPADRLQAMLLATGDEKKTGFYTPRRMPDDAAHWA